MTLVKSYGMVSRRFPGMAGCDQSLMDLAFTEALLLLIALTTSNADIQKLLAFEGAFDKLFAIVRQEGGIGSGGIVVQDCLAAIGGLLRWNVSNQVSRVLTPALIHGC